MWRTQCRLVFLLLCLTSAVEHNLYLFQSIFHRQEIVRQQMEAKAAKEKEELAKREAEQKRKSLEEQLTSSPRLSDPFKPSSNLTPLFSPALLAAHRASGRSIAPVSNTLALQRAKQKIDEIKAAKQLQEQQRLDLPSKTIAQTTAKGSNRVAHANKAVPQVTKTALNPMEI